LYNQLLHSNVPEDPYLSQELDRYFPAPIRRRYGRHLSRHRLRREIIATSTTNSVVNRMGPVFVLRAQEDTGAKAATIARAYAIAREVFHMRDLWLAIESLDNRVPAAAQYAMMYQTSRLLRHMTYWFMARHGTDLEIEREVSRLSPGIAQLASRLDKVLVATDLERYRAAVSAAAQVGVPERVAERVAGLMTMHSGLDIVEVAQERNTDVELTARTYFELGEQLSLAWVRDQIETLAIEGHWQAVARGSLRDNLYALQRNLTAKVLATRKSKQPAAAVESWLATRRPHVEYLQRTVKDMKAGVAADFPTLSVALQAVRRLAQ
jgi:glutamate dehydrogenase